MYRSVFGAISSPPLTQEKATKSNQNGAKTFQLGWFLQVVPPACPGMKFRATDHQTMFFIVKLSFRYYLMVRNTLGWLGVSRNVPEDLQLEKSWNFIWNLDFAWISLILKDFGGISWISMNSDEFWREFWWFPLRFRLESHRNRPETYSNDSTHVLAMFTGRCEYGNTVSKPFSMDFPSFEGLELGWDY